MEYNEFRVKPTLNRLNKEIGLLNNSYHNCKLLINYNVINVYIPLITDHCRKIMITLIIDKHYPFKPPDILINNIRYNNILKIISTKYNCNDNCLCCKSISCPDKWKPAYKIESILSEIIKFQNDIINFLPVDAYD